MQKKILTIFIFIFIFCACFTWAATNTQTQGDSFLSAGNPPSAFDPMSKVPITVISLILVGALAYLVLTFMGSKSWLPKISSKNIKIIERQYLGPKHSIFIVKVFNEYLLLGAAENSINTLKELNKEEVEKFLVENVEVDKISSKNYWSKFFSTKIPFKKQ